MNRQDVVLTGVPRSGTTLSCYLLNKLPNVVALNEPIAPLSLKGLETEVVIERVQDFFSNQRRLVLESGIAASMSINGAVPDNPMGVRDEVSGRRNVLFNGNTIMVDKRPDSDFTLVMKHPAFFTALLEPLGQRFHCVAVIRNPLAVLLSWNSVSVPISGGRTPVGEAFDSRLAGVLAGEADRISRQLILLSWCYDRYRRFLPSGQIVRYEEIISSGGKALVAVVPAATALDEKLESKNNNRQYDRSIMDKLAARLLASSGAYWDFYSREDVREVLDGLQAASC
jgi:hypothetical protein